MTTARTPELNAVERAQLDAWEAAAYSEDALRERMARAMWAADCGLELDEISGDTPAPYRRLADAALSVVRTPVEVKR